MSLFIVLLYHHNTNIMLGHILLNIITYYLYYLCNGSWLVIIPLSLFIYFIAHGLLCNFNSPDRTVFAKHLSSDLSKSRQVFFGLWSQGSVTPRQTLQVQLKNAARPRNENKDQPHCQTMATRTLQLLYIYLETNRSRLGLIWSDLCQLGAIVLDKFLIILGASMFIHIYDA